MVVYMNTHWFDVIEKLLFIKYVLCNYFRRTRQRPTKFLGRSIRHQWIINENSRDKEWYKGTVVSVLSGTDGNMNAVYEVLYDGEDKLYEIDHLIEDYRSGAVQFCDL